MDLSPPDAAAYDAWRCSTSRFSEGTIPRELMASVMAQPCNENSSSSSGPSRTPLG
jgi:hypothetical protein